MAQDKDKHFVCEEDFAEAPNTFTICNPKSFSFIITREKIHVEVTVQLGDEFRFVQAQMPVVGFRQEDAIKQNTNSAPSNQPSLTSSVCPRLLTLKWTALSCRDTKHLLPDATST